jgi:23S rRNA (guanosine2251-2'-O)-methyltransferase
LTGKGPAWRPRRPVQPGAAPDLFVVGGKRAATEAIRAGRARRLLVVTDARESEGLRSLIETARQAGLVPETVNRQEMGSLGVTDHQGVVAYVVPPRELDDRRFISTAFEADAVVVVLDGVVDPQNFGACARSAEAAGVAMLVTRKRRSAPMSAGALRASAGALLHLPVARVANLSRAVEQLKDKGLFVVGLDHRAATTIHAAQVPARPLALVVGAEETGISRLVREGCDQLVSIPLSGRTASLNASAALAVGLFGFALRPP